MKKNSFFAALVAFITFFFFFLLLAVNVGKRSFYPTFIIESLCEDVPSNGTFHALNGDYYYIEKKTGLFKNMRVFFCSVNQPEKVTELPDIDALLETEFVIGEYRSKLVVFTGERIFFFDQNSDLKDILPVEDVGNQLAELNYHSQLTAKRLSEERDGLYVIMNNGMSLRIFPTVGELVVLNYRVNPEAVKACPTTTMATVIQNTVYRLSRKDVPTRYNDSIRHLMAGYDAVETQSLGENKSDAKITFKTTVDQALIDISGKEYLIYDQNEKCYLLMSFEGEAVAKSNTVDYIKPFGIYDYKKCDKMIFVYDSHQRVLDVISEKGLFPMM